MPKIRSFMVSWWFESNFISDSDIKDPFVLRFVSAWRWTQPCSRLPHPAQHGLQGLPHLHRRDAAAGEPLPVRAAPQRRDRLPDGHLRQPVPYRARDAAPGLGRRRRRRTDARGKGQPTLPFIAHPSAHIPYPSPFTPHPSPLTLHPITPHPSPLILKPSPFTPHPPTLGGPALCRPRNVYLVVSVAQVVRFLSHDLRNLIGKGHRTSVHLNTAMSLFSAGNVVIARRVRHGSSTARMIFLVRLRETGPRTVSLSIPRNLDWSLTLGFVFVWIEWARCIFKVYEV